MTDSFEANMVTGSIPKHLLRTAYPLLFGMLGFATLEIADTFYLAHLSSDYVAALGYIFPLMAGVIALAVAFESGTAAIVSRALGEKKQQLVKQLTTDSMLLAFIFSIIVSILIFFNIDLILKLVNTPDNLMVEIRQFVSIWLWFIPCSLLTITGGAALRAIGHSNLEGGAMLLAAMINLILDPIFIFGSIGLPQWGLQLPFEGYGFIGAAIASLIGQAAALLFILFCLIKKYKICTPSSIRLSGLKSSVKQLSRIGLPAGIGHGTLMLSFVLLVGLVSSYGTDTVAGLVLGARVEQVVIIGFFSLGAALSAYSGQNYGAGKLDRILKAQDFTFFICIIGTLVVLGLTLSSADWALSFFVDDGSVKMAAMDYLLLVSFSYGLEGMMFCVCNTFNGMNKPAQALSLTLFRVLGLFLPLALIGNTYWGLKGVYIALAASNVLGGLIAYVYIRYWLTQRIKQAE